jgi:hypothetical protein
MNDLEKNKKTTEIKLSTDITLIAELVKEGIEILLDPNTEVHKQNGKNVLN